MSSVRIQQAGAGHWHDLVVDDVGLVECPLCRKRLPVATVVEHLQPRPSGAIFPMGDEEPVSRAMGMPEQW